MVIKRGGGSPEASGAALVALARRLGEGVDWDAIARIVDAGDERLSSSRLTAEAAAHAEASASGASIEQGTPCPVCCRQTKGVAACFAQGHLFRTAGGGAAVLVQGLQAAQQGRALLLQARAHAGARRGRASCRIVPGRRRAAPSTSRGMPGVVLARAKRGPARADVTAVGQ